MATIADDPEYWHKRAKETRTKADSILEPRMKSTMLRLAESYDMIAWRTEERLRLAKGSEPS